MAAEEKPRRKRKSSSGVESDSFSDVEADGSPQKKKQQRHSTSSSAATSNEESHAEEIQLFNRSNSSCHATKPNQEQAEQIELSEFNHATSFTATTSNEEEELTEDWVQVNALPGGETEADITANTRKKRKKLADIAYYPKTGLCIDNFERNKYQMEARVTSNVSIKILSRPIQPVKNTPIDWPVSMSFCLKMRRGKQSWLETSDGSCSGPGEECCSFEIQSDVADEYIDKDGMLKLYLYDNP